METWRQTQGEHAVWPKGRIRCPGVPEASERLLQRNLKCRAPLAPCLWNLQRTHSQSVVLCYGRPRMLRHWLRAMQRVVLKTKWRYLYPGQGLSDRNGHYIYSNYCLMGGENRAGPVFVWHWACFCIYFWKTWKYSKVTLGARAHTHKIKKKMKLCCRNLKIQ